MQPYAGPFTLDCFASARHDGEEVAPRSGTRACALRLEFCVCASI